MVDKNDDLDAGAEWAKRPGVFVRGVVENLSAPTATVSHRVIQARRAEFFVSAPVDAVTYRHGRGGSDGSRGSVDEKDNLELELRGRPPRGREGEKEVGELLVQRLNADGGSWSRVVHHEGTDDPVDVSAVDAEGDEIKIQIVRVSNQSRWATLGRTRQVDEELRCETAADELLDAIEKKSRTYGPHERRELTLAVDTLRHPSHTFVQVIESLRRRHGEKCREFGFRAVWVVGSRVELVYRVDI